MSAEVQESAAGQGARARGEGKDVILQLEGLSVSYGNIAAVQNLSMTVYAGEIVTLIGSNGAGKSTTLRTISGLLRPKSGDVVYEGKKINGIPGHDVVRLGISQSPEGRKIFQRMTVSENLDLGAYTRKDTAKIAEDRENVLELFPRLRERINQKAGTMSGGEQQMLAVARALLGDPRLLLLDEPSMGLAPVLVDVIFETIEKIRSQGVTVLLVEQNALAALEIADYAYVLESGRLNLEGEAAKLLDDPSVTAAYLGGHCPQTVRTPGSCCSRAFSRPGPRLPRRTREAGGLERLLLLRAAGPVLDDAVRDLAHRLAEVHGGLLDPAERLRLGQPEPGLQQALGAVDGLARLQALGQVRHLGLDRGDLGEAGPRDLDRRDQVGLAERLDDVRHGAREPRPVDQLALAERREHDHRRDPVGGDLLGRTDAVELGHLDVHDHQVGSQARRQLYRGLAVARLPDDVVALLGQHLDQVEADQRLVLGHDDPGR